MKKQSGIWLDKRIANIIHLDSSKINLVNVSSSIEETNIGGGSRSKQPYGPMDVSSESKLSARKNQQTNVYFEEIIDEISTRDEVFVFGPAETKTAFAAFVNGKNGFNFKITGVENADSMTINQKKAKVKEFFN